MQAEKRWSSWRPAIELRARVNIEDVHDAAALINPVDDATGAAPGAVTSGERPEQRLADPMRLTASAASQNSQHGDGNGFREPLGDCSPCGRLETDFIPLSGFACHAPVTRRRAKSWRTVAMSAPGSPCSRAARLSEISATASASP